MTGIHESVSLVSCGLYFQRFAWCHADFFHIFFILSNQIPEMTQTNFGKHWVPVQLWCLTAFSAIHNNCAHILKSHKQTSAALCSAVLNYYFLFHQSLTALREMEASVPLQKELCDSSVRPDNTLNISSSWNLFFFSFFFWPKYVLLLVVHTSMFSIRASSMSAARG